MASSPPLMPTLARPLVRQARLQRQAGKRAFTLIELLTVIAIIAILAAITFGVVKGVNERAAIAQAKAELSSLALSLEAYKHQYGDYPQAGSNAASPSTGSALADTSTQYYLFNALSGKLGPALAPITGKRFVDLARFSLETANIPAASGKTSVLNSFLDPWGRRYIYYYRGTGSAWTANKNFVLFSAGPDGTTGISINSSTGLITIESQNEKYEVDNLYVGSRPPKA